MYGLDFPSDENLIVGLSRADDAGVYKLSDDLAIIQTVDFFTPIVDDPYWFGQIAAANAISDIYAMGGIPKTALNLVAFPMGEMEVTVLRRILEGGMDKMREAGVVLAGGHSIEDKELKYGLAVTGIIHPDKVLTKHNPRPGDRLILTKPLGVGIITTAVKANMVEEALLNRVMTLMATLNRDAAAPLDRFEVHACTDVTGYGLLGHLGEMVQGSGMSVTLRFGAIPVIPETFDFARMGLIPGGAHRNREFREPMVRFEVETDRAGRYALYDPQTSGGLLIAVAEKHADALIKTLHENGVTDAAVIGEVVDEPEEKIVVR